MIVSFIFCIYVYIFFFFFFQAEDGIRDGTVTGVQTCALPIFSKNIEAFQQLQKTMQDQSQKVYGDNSRGAQELWAQFMNLQGPAMQSLMQAYMEQSQKMFAQFQEQMQSQARNMFTGFQFPGFPGQGKGDPEKK